MRKAPTQSMGDRDAVKHPRRAWVPGKFGYGKKRPRRAWALEEKKKRGERSICIIKNLLRCAG